MDPNSTEEVADNIEILEGQNFLGCMPPQVSALRQSLPNVSKWVAVVQLWQDCNGSIWIVVDEGELFGKVLDTNFADCVGDEYEFQYSGLVDWQRYIWSKIQLESQKPPSNVLWRIYNGPPRQWDDRIPWNCRNKPYTVEQDPSDLSDSSDSPDDEQEDERDED